jgi:hypothetical protein
LPAVDDQGVAMAPGDDRNFAIEPAATFADSRLFVVTAAIELFLRELNSTPPVIS